MVTLVPLKLIFLFGLFILRAPLKLIARKVRITNDTYDRIYSVPILMLGIFDLYISNINKNNSNRVCLFIKNIVTHNIILIK
jgi:hypothetical protein